MQLDTSLPKTEKGLAILLKTFADASKDRALWAVKQRRLSIGDVIEFDSFMLNKLCILSNERRKFLDHTKDFVETFVLEDNKCVEKDLNFFRDLHHSMVAVRTILVKTSPYHRMHGTRYRNVELPNIFEVSNLSSTSTKSDDLFGIESFGKEVRSLCGHITEFFQSLYDTIAQCFAILREEKTVKNDPDLCEFYYNMFAEAIIKEFMQNMDLLGLTPSVLNNQLNPLYKIRKEFGDNEKEFLQWLYHNGNPKHVRIYVLKKRFCGEDVNDITPEEHILFGNDSAKVKKIRFAIAHFNQIARKPKTRPFTKIDAKDIASFALWCGREASKPAIHAFYPYFINSYSKSPNCLSTPQEDRVYKAARIVTNEERSSFNQRLNIVYTQAQTAEKKEYGAETA